MQQATYSQSSFHCLLDLKAGSSGVFVSKFIHFGIEVVVEVADGFLLGASDRSPPRTAAGHHVRPMVSEGQVVLE